MVVSLRNDSYKTEWIWEFIILLFFAQHAVNRYAGIHLDETVILEQSEYGYQSQYLLKPVQRLPAER